ncbi:MAG: hypothetical protein F4Z16_07725, partial [Rhodothermaceae bacterium]|nr:hypothetical protein [Rhodothermaceae bacterium]
MKEHSKKSTGTVSSISLILGTLLFTAGCYTQLGSSYFEREPDYQEVTEYSTPHGDSVVVDNYYYDHYYYRSSRYRRHFATFYGHPYSFDPFYDPFYDDYWYGGSSLYLSFGWGRPFLYSSPYRYGWYDPYFYAGYPYGGGGYSHWGYGYYGTPWGYRARYAGNYGPRGSRIGRGGVRSRGGRYGTDRDDILVGRRNAVADRGKQESVLARSRTRGGVVAAGSRTRGVQRSVGEDEAVSRTRRGVTRSVPADRGTVRRGTINGTRSSTRPTTRSTPRTRSSSGTRSSTRPTTRSTPRTRSSSGTRTSSRPTTRSTP